jgi:hypothetical protein
MPDQNLSAFAALRALRDEFRAPLDQSEDYADSEASFGTVSAHIKRKGAD